KSYQSALPPEKRGARSTRCPSGDATPRLNRYSNRSSIHESLEGSRAGLTEPRYQRNQLANARVTAFGSGTSWSHSGRVGGDAARAAPIAVAAGSASGTRPASSPDSTDSVVSKG